MTAAPIPHTRYAIAVDQGEGRRSYHSWHGQKDWWLAHVLDADRGWVQPVQTVVALPTSYASLDDALDVLLRLREGAAPAFGQRMFIIDTETGDEVRR